MATMRGPPAPRPCNRRPANIIAGVVAIIASTVPAMNTPQPNIAVRLRPMLSDSGP